ncbi:MAG: PH domain-containing protein [Chloroflexota bacterium]
MGLISGLLGNAAELRPEKVQKNYDQIFIPGEEVQAAFQIVRDMFVFTNKRLILIDKQGITGNKMEFKSFPSKSIKYFSVETAGTFDRDAELKVWVGNSDTPTISKQLKRGIDVVGLQRTLAYFVMS